MLGTVGGAILLITYIVYRKLSGKKDGKLNWKVIGKIIYGVFSSLVFGAGLCLVMAFEGMILTGIVVGIVGIVLLLLLIPMCVGLKDSKKMNA